MDAPGAVSHAGRAGRRTGVASALAMRISARISVCIQVRVLACIGGAGLPGLSFARGKCAFAASFCGLLPVRAALAGWDAGAPCRMAA